MKASTLIGLAIKDYQNGAYTHDLFQETAISEKDELPLPYLFRSYNQMPDLEQIALEKAKGQVLDVGAGAGSHSLFLQEKGFNVTALDTNNDCIAACKARGIKRTVISNLLDYNTQQFDTILLLMNGTGIFEQLANVPVYLKHLKSLLNPGGQILIDSSDLVYMYDRLENGAIMVPAALNYYGELACTLCYKELESEPYYWLYLDQKTFKDCAVTAGFNFKVIATGENHDYLARLTL